MATAAAVEPSGDLRADRMRALIRPEFLVEVYIADADDPVLATSLTGSGGRQWRRREQGRTFDFRPAPSLMQLELQYALQCRHDARRGYWRSWWVNRVARVCQGLSDEASFCTTPPPDTLFGQYSRSGWRYITTVARDAYDELSGRRGLSDRDMWDLRKLGYSNGPFTRHLDFARIPQAWLRQATKQCVQYQMSRVTGGQLGSYVRALVRLACWLDEHHTPPRAPGDVTRPLLEQFVICMRSAHSSRQAMDTLLYVKAFLEDAERFEWGTFAGRLYDSDIPRRPELAPRAIEEFVMSQLEMPEVLAKIENPDIRAAIELLMLVGMRISECCRLPFQPLSYDHAGAPQLTVHITKTGVAQNVIPVSQRVVEIVEEQQRRVVARYGGELAILFPRKTANPDGIEHMTAETVRWGLRHWLQVAGVRDRRGQAVTAISPHQFRHTLGTRMVNQGISTTVIKRLLGHKTAAMTEHYARVNDQTLRKEFERFAASRVNIRGELLQPACSEAEWTKERLARALVTTQNGYCGRPLQLDCPHPNACLTCPDFLTDVSHLGGHRRQLTETQRLISAAELAGNTRVLEMNRQVATNLETIIASLGPFELEGAADATE